MQIPTCGSFEFLLTYDNWKLISKLSKFSTVHCSSIHCEKFPRARIQVVHTRRHEVQSSEAAEYVANKLPWRRDDVAVGLLEEPTRIQETTGHCLTKEAGKIGRKETKSHKTN